MHLINSNPFLRMASFIDYYPRNKQGVPQDCRIIFITKGTARVVVSDNRYMMKENSLFYCRAGMPYKLEGNEELKLYVLNFDLTDSNSDLLQTIPVIFDGNIKEFEYDSVDDAPFLNSYLFIDNGEVFRDDIAFISDEMMNRGVLSRELASAQLKQLIIKIQRSIISKPVLSKQLKTVTDFIHTHFTEEITNKQLAEIAGYHEYHLNRLFNESFGRSVHQYIIDLRLEKAKQLLISGNDSVSRVAELCGFTNFTYFSGYFSKRFGCSPLKYRSRYRKIL